MTQVLVCSLGGSPAPIISAIRTKRPAFVLFVASTRDGMQPGSDEQVPGISAAAGLPAERYAVQAVPTDNPDTAFQLVLTAVEALRARLPKPRFTFDYTGGTKSMTAALLQVALCVPGSDLQIMIGQRRDLVQVTANTERPHPIYPDWMRAQRDIQRNGEGWRSFAYAEAAAGFAALLEVLEGDEAAGATLARLRDLRVMSAAFAEWDRFRHAEAQRLLRPLASRHGAFLAPYLRALEALCAPHAATAQPARMADLWHNARRAAARGRFDDAVARCYRLLEWLGQWRLLDGFALRAEQMEWGHKSLTPSVLQRAGLVEQQGRRTLTGLMQTLKLCAALEPGGAIAAFLGRVQETRLKQLLELRNRSILAHGTEALTQQEWERFRDMMECCVADVLRPEMSRCGLAFPAQLPVSPPA